MKVLIAIEVRVNLADVIRAITGLLMAVGYLARYF